MKTKKEKKREIMKKERMGDNEKHQEYRVIEKEKNERVRGSLRTICKLI